jgi:3-phosphoshikimate 1-carboxyvinyltransferase
VQGDLAFIDILEHMGCQVIRERHATTVSGAPLRGVDVDMNAISDTVMTLAVVALFASGHTRIRNVAHIRHKETDRISALATELRKLGATVDEQADGLVIFPPARISPARVATYDDHRMAMSFALAGLKAEGITILEPSCVAKTYPGFWADLSRLAPGSV